MSKTTKLMIKLENTHTRNLLRLSALKRFYDNIGNTTVDVKSKKTKHKERLLSDEDIRSDLNMIFAKKYEIGAKVKVLLIDEAFYGEIVRADSKDVVVKLINGEKLKINMNSIKNEMSKIIFLKD